MAKLTPLKAIRAKCMDCTALIGTDEEFEEDENE